MDVLVTRYVSPVLRAAGYSRSARTFRKQVKGDWAILHVDAGLRLGDGIDRFHLLRGIGPAPVVEFAHVLWRRPAPGGPPGLVEMFQLGGIPNPLQIQIGSPRTTEWAFNPNEGLDLCGAAVREALQGMDGVPLLERLLDRDELIRYIASGAQTGELHPVAAAQNEIKASADRADPDHLRRLYELVPDNGTFFRARLGEWMEDLIRGRQS